MEFSFVCSTNMSLDNCSECSNRCIHPPRVWLSSHLYIWNMKYLSLYLQTSQEHTIPVAPFCLYSLQMTMLQVSSVFHFSGCGMAPYLFRGPGMCIDCFQVFAVGSHWKAKPIRTILHSNGNESAGDSWREGNLRNCNCVLESKHQVNETKVIAGELIFSK